MEKELECARITAVVRKHPFIWYKLYPNRCNGNQDKWNQEWDMVAAELGTDKAEVKSKWRAYAYAYVRSLRKFPKLEAGQDLTEYLKPKYKKNRLFKYCLFLGDTRKSNLADGSSETGLLKLPLFARVADVVRQHPFIWYKFYPGRYRNEAKWHQEWQKIAAKLGENETEVKKRWLSCRTRFARDMRRLPKLQAGQDITEYLKPEYKVHPYFKHLLYLGDPHKSGLTPSQLFGEEEINYESNCENRKLENNYEININFGNDWELGNTECLNDIEDDEFMYNIDEETKRELEQAEQEFLPNTEEINESKAQSELGVYYNDTNYNDKSNVIDMRNIESETEPSLCGDTIVIDDDDDDDDEEQEKNIEFSRNKGNDLRMEESQSLLMPQHQPRLENYSNINNMNRIGGVMDFHASQSSKANNVKKSSENRLDCDNVENLLFLRSLLPYFRQLNTIEQMQVRIEFEEVVTSALSNKRP